MQWRDTFAAARVRVTRSHPYYTEALFSLIVVPAENIGTMGVDQWGRLYVDPKIVEAWGAAGCAAVLRHELNHLLRQHHGRCLGRDQMQWNIAGDAEINDDIERDGADALPKLGLDGKPAEYVTPRGLGLPNGETAEWYFDHLPKQPPKGGAGRECGGASGKQQPWEQSPGEAGAPRVMEPGDIEVIRKRTAEAVRTHVNAHGRGSVPAGLADWAERLLAPPRIDWRRQLRSLTRGAINAASGSDHSTWSRLNRRYWSQRAVVGARAMLRPSLMSIIPKVVVVLDTSGSMTSGTRLQDAMSEVMGIVKGCGAEATVLSVDAAVHATTKVRTKRDVKRTAVGFGGTDMRLGILEGLKHKPNVVVVLTDGETGWTHPGEVPPTVRLIAAVVTSAEVPPHIKHVVRVADDEQGEQ